ncbi:unnamed protein product, partial [Trichogramma brassicae]
MQRRQADSALQCRDKEGRTPLEYAVSRLLPRVVDVLLAKHANLSGFVFPTAAHFTEILNLGLLHDYHFKLRIAAGALSIVEKLESRGYDLDRSNALAIMDLFAKSKVLEKPTNLDESWYDHQSFVSKAQEVMICQDFSLYDLIRLRAKDAAHKLTPTGYYDEFVCMRKLNHILRIHKEVCAIHLCVKLSRKFFHEWAQDPMWELFHGRLPIECCDMIIDNLNNDDLHRILLAATPQSEQWHTTRRNESEFRLFGGGIMQTHPSRIGSVQGRHSRQPPPAARAVTVIIAWNWCQIIVLTVGLFFGASSERPINFTTARESAKMRTTVVSNQFPILRIADSGLTIARIPGVGGERLEALMNGKKTPLKIPPPTCEPATWWRPIAILREIVHPEGRGRATPAMERLLQRSSTQKAMAPARAAGGRVAEECGDSAGRLSITEAASRPASALRADRDEATASACSVNKAVRRDRDPRK